MAVIGGGIGGSTAAYFLREELGDDADILLYEKDRIGGRVATVKMGDRFYESGMYSTICLKDIEIARRFYL